MSVISIIESGTGNVDLDCCPIHGKRTLEGSPFAHNTMLSQSDDGDACTLLSNCTAGLFNWFHDVDEIIYVLERCAIVRDVLLGLRVKEVRSARRT